MKEAPAKAVELVLKDVISQIESRSGEYQFIFGDQLFFKDRNKITVLEINEIKEMVKLQIKQNLNFRKLSRKKGEIRQ